MYNSGGRARVQFRRTYTCTVQEDVHMYSSGGRARVQFRRMEHELNGETQNDAQ